MIRNQQGGIISKIFIIPVGVGLMVGFFFLGYYVGKYQSKTNQSEIVVPLPEVVSNNLPKNGDFTFFKTLTDKGNRTISIDLKPSPTDPAPAEKKTVDLKNDDTEKGRDKPGEPLAVRKFELKTEKPEPARARSSEQTLQTARQEPAAKTAVTGNIRYTLQLASYPDKIMAEGDVKKMKERGYAAFIVSSDIEGKGIWYRVRVGSFSNKGSAEKLQKELRTKLGLSPFITIE
jgi:cell division protein FtsN